MAVKILDFDKFEGLFKNKEAKEEFVKAFQQKIAEGGGVAIITYEDKEVATCVDVETALRDFASKKRAVEEQPSLEYKWENKLGPKATDDKVLSQTSPSILQSLGIVPGATFVEAVQQHFWGTFGVNGAEPLQYKKLVDLDTAHLWSILETQHQIREITKRIIRHIITNRKE